MLVNHSISFTNCQYCISHPPIGDPSLDLIPNWQSITGSHPPIGDPSLDLIHQLAVHHCISSTNCQAITAFHPLIVNPSLHLIHQLPSNRCISSTNCQAITASHPPTAKQSLTAATANLPIAKQSLTAAHSLLRVNLSISFTSCQSISASHAPNYQTPITYNPSISRSITAPQTSPIRQSFTTVLHPPICHPSHTSISQPTTGPTQSPIS